MSLCLKAVGLIGVELQDGFFVCLAFMTGCLALKIYIGLPAFTVANSRKRYEITSGD